MQVVFVLGLWYRSEEFGSKRISDGIVPLSIDGCFSILMENPEA